MKLLLSSNAIITSSEENIALKNNIDLNNLDQEVKLVQEQKKALKLQKEQHKKQKDKELLEEQLKKEQLKKEEQRKKDKQEKKTQNKIKHKQKLILRTDIQLDFPLSNLIKYNL